MLLALAIAGCVVLDSLLTMAPLTGSDATGLSLHGADA